jgi:peptidoglycan/LPS O-acetylase OafA/YrhL
MPALDGLRGLAVAGVLLFHGDHLTGGYLGVDLFFVLSGFLITSLLLGEVRATGRVDLRRFWSRRARRLLPALAGMLLGVACYSAFLAHHAELGPIRGDALATLAYVANWRSVLARQDYWSLFRSPSPLQHTWSLAIEEQFYALWPLVVLGVVTTSRRATAPAVLVVSLLLAAVSSALMVVLYDPADVSRVYYGTDTRLAPVLLGAALAAAIAWRGHAATRRSRLAVEAAACVGGALLTIAWTRLDGQSATLYRGGFLVCAICATAVVAAAAHPVPLLVGRVLRFRPLCVLGLVSYGTYLWHWPVFVALDPRRTGLDGWSLLGVRVAVTLALAGVSFALVERPVRRGALAPRHWRAAVPAVAVALVGVTLAVTTAAEPAVAKPTRPPTTFATRPTRPGVVPPVRVLMTGDSVAVSLMPGLQRAQRAAHLDVALGAAVGCDANGDHRALPGTAVPSGSCPPPLVEQVARSRPDIVVMVDSGVWSLHDVHVGGRTLRIGTPDWDAARIADWQQKIDAFSRWGAHVVITTIAYLPPTSDSGERSARSPSVVDRANADFLTIAARNPRTVTLVDLRGYVCPHGRFQDGLDGVDQLRPDGVHYGPGSSDLVGRWLASRLATIGRTPISVR